MFSNEDESAGGKNKKKGKLGKILKKASALITPTTVLLGVAAAISATGVTLEDIKSGLKTAKSILSGIGTGLSSIWEFLKKSYQGTKYVFTKLAQLPERISLGIAKVLPNVMGGISNNEYNAKIAVLDTESTTSGEQPKYKLIVNADGTTTQVPNKEAVVDKDNNTSNAAGVVETAVGAYAARKVYNGYKRTKRIVNTAGKVTTAAIKTVNKARGVSPTIDATKKVVGKITPQKKGIVTKLMSFLNKIKSKIVKKVGGKAATKLLAKLALRSVPFIGAGLLAYDAGKVIYNLMHGDSFKSAASKAILGVDLFEDDDDGIKLKSGSNVIHAENRFGSTDVTESTDEPSNSNKIKTQMDYLLNANTDGETKPNAINSKSKNTSIGSIPVDKSPVVTGNMDSVNKSNNVDVTGLNAQVAKNLLGMAAEYKDKTGKKLSINSAYRSFAYQKALRDKLGSKAARPGKSTHEFGLAVDINSDDANELEELGLMRKYGFTRPIGGETWHLEPAVVQTDVDRAKKDPDFATAAAKASLYRGGGGQGLEQGVRKYSRNKKLQVDLLNASEKEVKTKSNVIDIASKLPTAAGKSALAAIKSPTGDNIDGSEIANVVDIKDRKSLIASQASTADKLATVDRSEASSKPLINVGDTNPTKINAVDLANNNLAPIIKVEPNITVTTSNHIDDSKHLPVIAEMGSQAVDLQTQMLNVLGDISGKLDRSFTNTETDSRQVTDRPVPLTPPRVNISRRLKFG